MRSHIGAMKLFMCHENLTRATMEIEHYMDILLIDHPL
jgi:hypothetical protein